MKVAQDTVVGWLPLCATVELVVAAEKKDNLFETVDGKPESGCLAWAIAEPPMECSIIENETEWKVMPDIKPASKRTRGEEAGGAGDGSSVAEVTNEEVLQALEMLAEDQMFGDGNAMELD